jgi:D-alanyl-D-alanine carboxypeptidase
MSMPSVFSLARIAGTAVVVAALAGCTAAPAAERGSRPAPSFAPGERFEYSNTNFILLGKVIEEVTGKPFAEALDVQILEPLELTHTSFPDDAVIPHPHPQGYTLQGTPDDSHEPVNSTDWSPSFGGRRDR